MLLVKLADAVLGNVLLNDITLQDRKKQCHLTRNLTFKFHASSYVAWAQNEVNSTVKFEIEWMISNVT